MKSLSVYFVDNNVKFLDSAVNYLDSCPKVGSIAWSFSFTESFDKIKEFKPDVILVDFSMIPEMVLTKAKNNRVESDLPKIYVVSAHDDKLYKDEAYAAGADGFILKENFVKEIRSLINEFSVN